MLRGNISRTKCFPDKPGQRFCQPGHGSTFCGGLSGGSAILAAQISTAFAELRNDTAELPGRLHALSNEVADIEFVLYQVVAALQERNCMSDSDQGSIPDIFDYLAGSCTRRRVLWRAAVWRKWLPKLQALQADVRAIKCSLNVLLGASNSRDLIRVRLDLESLSRTSSNEADYHADFRLEVSRDLAQHDFTLAQTVDQATKKVHKVDERISRIEELLMAQAVSIDKSQYPESRLKPQPTALAMRRRPQRVASTSDTEKWASTPQAVGIRVKKNVGFRLVKGFELPSQPPRPIATDDDCPAAKACDILLRGNLSTSVIEVLRCILRDSEFIMNQNFAPIHKIVLELSLQDSETEMQCAAQHWSGQPPAEMTEHFGGKPNITDNKLNTPLTLASNQDNTLCVQLLLEAGALANPVLPLGVKLSSPLNCAARYATDPLLLKTLFDFDADVEASSVDGVAPLLHVARGKPVSFAELLLDYGADINPASKNGLTSLTAAIIFNNHSVLRLLLDRWFEYTECPRLKGHHLLEFIIDYADIETIYVPEKSAAQLRKRLDLTDDRVLAFESLLDAIRDYPKLSKYRESLANSGALDLEKDPESNGEDTDDYEDARGSLSIVSNDLSTLARQPPRPAVVVSAAEEQ
ncbi:hypothetical protein HO133_002925 [Letharia lupina]|uniref:Ankyrin n=1 Tax=Letharia lupina TaxID=560253 RepID=A0A8H6F9Q7_9LECA|nr:uncharacterized protein HO133_002925 [Letharia lupina]KAF6220492.1 hypothetical protein HO133_002925 [Letharia lupina]